MIDFYKWTQAQAQALRDGRWAQVDTLAVAEELEDMGRSERGKIRNQMIRLLEHRLKIRFVATPGNLRGWAVSADDAIDEIKDVIDDNPSLAGYPREILPHAYQRARKRVLGEYDLHIPVDYDKAFPSGTLGGLAEFLS